MTTANTDSTEIVTTEWKIQDRSSHWRLKTLMPIGYIRVLVTVELPKIADGNVYCWGIPSLWRKPAIKMAREALIEAGLAA